MTKHSYRPGRTRYKGGANLGRADQITEDDRPFAEVRKNLHNALGMLALHRWAFFVPFSLVASTVFILSLYYPRLYRASTTFERKNDPVMMNLPMSAGAASFEQYRSTMARDLTSLKYMREVVGNLPMTKDLERGEDGALTPASARRRDSFARSLASTLSLSTVSPNPHLDITTITYTGSDPELGKKLVREAKKVFIRLTKEWIFRFLMDQRVFWAKEADAARAEYKVARRKETTFRMENPHADPTNPGGISLRLAQREMERRELLMRKREYESELSVLQQMLAAVTPFGQTGSADGDASVENGNLPSRGAIRLFEQIYALDREVTQLMRTRGMTTQHPKVKNLLDHRRWLEQELHQQRVRDGDSAAPQRIPVTAPVPNGLLLAGTDSSTARVFRPGSENERGRFLVQIRAQKAKLADIEISLGTNGMAIEQDRRAKRQVHEKQEEFADILAGLAKARQKLGLREGTVSTIDPAINAFEKDKLLLFSEGTPARGSHRPISPKATTIVVLAILAGLATGTLFVILAEVFDNVYRSSSQVARSLGLPMLESIDEIVTSEDRRYIFLRRMVVAPILLVGFIGLTSLAGSMAYLSIEQPHTYQKLSRVPRAVLHLFAATPQNQIN